MSFISKLREFNISEVQNIPEPEALNMNSLRIKAQVALRLGNVFFFFFLLGGEGGGCWFSFQGLKVKEIGFMQLVYGSGLGLVRVLYKLFSETRAFYN